MSEIEYSQLAGHITERLDNTAEYEDWLIIQEYIDKLQSDLTKEQLAYVNLRDTFNKSQQEIQQLKEQLQQKDEVIVKVRELVNNDSNYDDGDFEARVFQNDILQIIDKVGGNE